MDMKQFNKVLASIDSKANSLQQDIHKMGVFALHCVNIGKTTGVDSPIQRLWNTLAKYKGINRQAFMDWSKEFGNLMYVKMEDGTFLVKYSDKTKKDPTFNPVEAVEQADGIPFWEFAKEPTPNTKPYDVFESMRHILTQAKAAATGGAKGDKPIRQVEHKEGLDMIAYILENPTLAREKLGLLAPSEMVVFTKEELEETTELMQAALAEGENNRQALRAA
jgi:hypothetical protein